MKTGRKAVLAFAASLALGGCGLFSLTPDADLVAEIHQRIPVGTSVDSAEANLADLDFACRQQRGAYTDERGNDHENAHFLQCTRRPGKISFACENRDQVVIVPGETGKVVAVEVSHGPDCGNR